MAEKEQELSSSDDQNKGENKKQEDAKDAKPNVTVESPGGKKLPKKSPTKSPTKSPAKPTKSKPKKKEPSEDEGESEDEELVGILDKPLVIEGKRERKTTDFLMNSLKNPVSVEKKKVDVPQGKGETLGSMPRVQFQLNRIVADELKPLHKVLFGRPGVNSEVKKNIRCFNGYDFEKDSKEYSKKLELIERFTNDSLRRLCEILDVDKKGMKKEEIPLSIMVFLMNPMASGKAIPNLKKKSRKQPETKRTSKKEEKDSSKEEAEDESGSGNEEEDEEKEKPAPKKEKKSAGDEEKKEKKKEKKRKRETKKETKKEKKVFAVKITPGKKSKKAKKDDPVVSSDDEPLIKKAKKSPPTDDEIVDLVKDLLDGADLEKITMKSVCRQVYERFPDFDLTDRKEFIKDTVKEIIT